MVNLQIATRIAEQKSPFYIIYSWMSVFGSGAPMLLENLLKQSADSPKLHLREAMYGAVGQSLLLREVMGLANSKGSAASRYILFGVKLIEEGKYEFRGVTKGDLNELQGYAEIISNYLEPDLKVTPMYGEIQGHMVGALEINHCSNPPYIVKVDAGTKLHRGDCWVREGGLFRPAQRADLDRMYQFAAAKRPTPLGENIVRIGFGDDPNKMRLQLTLPDVTNPPSKLAAGKMQDEIDAKRSAAAADIDDTRMGRLIHARLFGEESDFTGQGIDTMVEGYNAVMERYSDHDNYYNFETHAVKFNLSMVNTGHEAIENISLMLVLPVAQEFIVADRLFPAPGKSRTPKESELLGYPRVKAYSSSVQVKYEIDRLEPDQLIQVYEQDLRIAVQSQLAGKKVRVKCSMHASGFAQPEETRLTLLFSK
jgi:hypothetical protein